jgi:hypothetical protein
VITSWFPHGSLPSGCYIAPADFHLHPCPKNRSHLYPRAQPFAEETLSAIKGESGPAHRALRKLIELELLREEQRDGRRRVWVHDARLAFYLRA